MSHSGHCIPGHSVTCSGLTPVLLPTDGVGPERTNRNSSCVCTNTQTQEWQPIIPTKKHTTTTTHRDNTTTPGPLSFPPATNMRQFLSNNLGLAGVEGRGEGRLSSLAPIFFCLEGCRAPDRGQSITSINYLGYHLLVSKYFFLAEGATSYDGTWVPILRFPTPSSNLSNSRMAL